MPGASEAARPIGSKWPGLREISACNRRCIPPWGAAPACRKVALCLRLPLARTSGSRLSAVRSSPIRPLASRSLGGRQRLLVTASDDAGTGGPLPKSSRTRPPWRSPAQCAAVQRRGQADTPNRIAPFHRRNWRSARVAASDAELRLSASVDTLPHLHTRGSAGQASRSDDHRVH